MYSVLDIAKYVLDFFGYEHCVSINYLENVLFFLQIEHLLQTGDSLFQEDIYRSYDGVRIKEIREKYKYKPHKFTNYRDDQFDYLLSDNDIEMINNALKKLQHYDEYSLTERTIHNELWKNHRNPILLPSEILENYFTETVKKRKELMIERDASWCLLDL